MKKSGVTVQWAYMGRSSSDLGELEVVQHPLLDAALHERPELFSQSMIPAAFSNAVEGSPMTSPRGLVDDERQREERDLEGPGARRRGAG